MKPRKITFQTKGEALYPITDLVRNELSDILITSETNSGILYLFTMHTSCAMTISEDFDPTARKDLESFLDHLAPRNLRFIQHKIEGPDDSPSHMKSALLHQSLDIIVDEGELILGTWQGIFLAEFRDQPKNRTILVKFCPDYQR